MSNFISNNLCIILCFALINLNRTKRITKLNSFKLKSSTKIILHFYVQSSVPFLIIIAFVYIWCFLSKIFFLSTLWLFESCSPLSNYGWNIFFVNYHILSSFDRRIECILSGAHWDYRSTSANHWCSDTNFILFSIFLPFDTLCVCRLYEVLFFKRFHVHRYLINFYCVINISIENTQPVHIHSHWYSQWLTALFSQVNFNISSLAHYSCTRYWNQ